LKHCAEDLLDVVVVGDLFLRRREKREREDGEERDKTFHGEIQRSE